MQRIVLFILRTLGTLAPALQGWAADGKVIEASAANAAWHVAPDGMSAVLVAAAADGTATLEIQKAKLKSPELRLTLETDAPQVMLSSGAAEIPVALTPDAAVELQLDTSDANPVLKVGGKESARTRGKWIELSSRQKEPVVRLKLTKATYATATFAKVDAAQQPPARPAAQTPPTRPPAPAVKPSPQPGTRAAPGGSPTSGATTTGGRTLDRAKQAVFQVRIKDAEGKTVAGGSGFLCAAGGFGITNYHVVSGGRSATAVFAGEEQERRLELWAVRRDLDLALVKIMGDAQGVDARGVLVEGTTPTEGQEVWALGFPLDLGYSVTRGVVNGVRKSAQLPEPVRNAFAGVKSWVQTDCTINPGNSGGPLIDSAGELVGVNTWIFLAGKNVFFALSASEIAPLLADTSKKPVGFSAVAGDSQEAAPGSWQSFVTQLPPRLDIKQTGTSDQLRGIVTGFTSGLSKKCASCGGDGIVRAKVTVGRTSIGRPIQEMQPRPCQKCDRSGVIAPPAATASKLAGNVCQGVATLKPADPNAEKSLNAAYVALTQSIPNPATLAAMLNEQAMARLAQGTLKTQEPLVVAADYLFGGVREEDSAKGTAGDGDKNKPKPTTTTTASTKSSAAATEPERLHVLRVFGSDQIVIVSAPRFADEVMTGPVFAGGLNAGALKLPDGTRVVVLQGGFMVKALRLRVTPTNDYSEPPPVNREPRNSRYLPTDPAQTSFPDRR